MPSELLDNSGELLRGSHQAPHTMARTRVLLFVAALLLVSSELCTAQTVDKVSGAPTSLEQQKAASREEGKVASTKANARVSQMRDPTGWHLVYPDATTYGRSAARLMHL